MTADQELALVRHFAEMPDPRLNRTKKHHLSDILIITLCATIAGADSWEEVRRFGQAKLNWLKGFLPLPHGNPSHDIFNRVYARLDPKPYGPCVAEWIDGVCRATGLRHVTIDGKSARSEPKATSTGCLHLVNAWAAESRLILGQVSVADGSNEIAAILELLRVLELKGAIVTIDAAGCQTAIAGQICEQGGDYLLAVKGNQPGLHEAVMAAFGEACETDFEGVENDGDEQVEDGHGRHEERYTTVIYNPEGLPEGWPDVAAVVLIGRERRVKRETASTAHYYLTSLRPTAAELGRPVRRHWSVESELHLGARHGLRRGLEPDGGACRSEPGADSTDRRLAAPARSGQGKHQGQAFESRTGRELHVEGATGIYCELNALALPHLVTQPLSCHVMFRR